ncbi:hypothetical protein [Actibacterium ureilyticum]|uniref:hypothetical protein n=1 Tax=Actibacterium ureilyticum TaxID=1590614 RepID=UPI000BAAC7E7|nr:hypothetical protein [Actibacterium ureilyticum]
MVRKRMTTALMAAVAINMAAPTFANTMVRDVQVEIDMEAISNFRGAEYWNNVSEDLSDEIMKRISTQLTDDSDGAKITVDIDELSLATTLEEAARTEDSRLSGAVSVTNPANNTDFDHYDLTVTFAEIGPFFPEGTDLTQITTDSEEYYNTMVDVFAERVAEKLK